MEKIASFQVDHTTLRPGMYLSRRDGNVVTFDLRFKVPNTGDLLTNAEMHSVEHIIPMGCQTGFYVLLDNNQLTMEDCIALVQSVFEAGANYTGEMPGKSAVECGNYINLDVDLARTQCRYYADLIRDWTVERLAY